MTETREQIIERATREAREKADKHQWHFLYECGYREGIIAEADRNREALALMTMDRDHYKTLEASAYVALQERDAKAAKDRELLQMAADALADPHKMSKGAEALSALKDAGITPTEA